MVRESKDTVSFCVQERHPSIGLEFGTAGLRWPWHSSLVRHRRVS